MYLLLSGYLIKQHNQEQLPEKRICIVLEGESLMAEQAWQRVAEEGAERSLFKSTQRVHKAGQGSKLWRPTPRDVLHHQQPETKYSNT